MPTSATVQPADLARFRTVPDAQIAPDGRRVAYVVQQIDLERDRYRSAIWLVDGAGGEPGQVTAGECSDTTPRWSPDGRRLAFISDRTGSRQLYVLPLGGGEPRRLTDLPRGVGTPVWSPDGSRIAFTAAVEAEPLAADADADARARWEMRPRAVDAMRYKRDGEGFTYDRHSAVFVVPSDGSAPPLQLTDGPYDDRDPAWSPDGGTIAFCSARHDSRDQDTLVGLYTVPAGGGDARLITSLGRLCAPAWSPDGRTIAVYATTDDGQDWSAHYHVWLAPLDGGPPRDLMPDHDRSAFVQPPPFLTPRPAWTGDGGILFAAADRGNVGLLRVPAAGGARAIVLAGERQITAWNRATDGTLTFVATDLETPADVFVSAADGSDERRLTRLNDGLLTEMGYTPPVRRSFATPHGEIDGWVMRPAGASGPGPLLLDIHGGPHSFFGSVFPLNPFYWLVAVSRGWTVLATNPTGSGSYGRDFARALLGQWGEYDLPEQLAAVDALIGEGVADPARLAVTGYSYGGYMTSWTVGHSDRFRAAVIGAPVTNLESFHGTSDIGPFFGPFEMGGPLLDQRETFRRLSPVQYLDRVTTPCLVLHGEADDRCPIGQGEEWFVGLRAQNKPVEFVRYPGASHAFRGAGRPSHRIDYTERLIGWIERFTPAPAAPEAKPAAAVAGDA